MERLPRSCPIAAFGMLLLGAGLHAAVSTQAGQLGNWQERILAVPYEEPAPGPEPVLQVVQLSVGNIEIGRSVVGTPMKMGDRLFEHGLGTHAISDIRVFVPEAIKEFSAWVGVDGNANAQAGTIVFSVSTEERELYRSPVLRQSDGAQRVRVNAGGAHALHLRVAAAGDGIGCDHADWGDAKVVTQSGNTLWLDELKFGVAPAQRKNLFPFSFVYGDKPSDGLLPQWQSRETTETLDGNRTEVVKTWTDSQTKLAVEWHAVSFSDFPAVEWILCFQNTGSSDTPILADIQSLDLYCQERWIDSDTQYRLYKTNGAPSNPTDFEVETVPMQTSYSTTMGGRGGRSSDKDFPFFKIEAAGVSYIFAVGWSGQWRSDIACEQDGSLHVRAGLEKTHFLLHPGERVRMPRILMLRWEGDTWESNAQFRRLIYKHYAAKRNGRNPMPVVFSNTCFTEYGLGDTANAQNQIALIRALGPLGVEAVVTDAGWMEGSQGDWWKGCGNWYPRKDNYPDGMALVAKAAHEEGMIYGLWAEVETVIQGTWIHRNHPEWLLDIGAHTLGNTPAALLNFGAPRARAYLAETMAKFTELPGFGFYRQDFGLLDPTPFWRKQDEPNRQGIAEIKYICGLYDYWERIAQACPNGLREECAAGGRRIDLETVMRMHIHQKTDYWFDNVVDQASIWALSQYLPNHCFVAQLNRLDDYSFHSTLASSLCLGWTADKESFDSLRGRELVRRYKQVRHLLVGAWYPLTHCSRDTHHWLACQYHRPDLNEGIILAFRRDDSPYQALDVTLQGLGRESVYEVSSDRTGVKERYTGAELTTCYTITLGERHSSDLIVYRNIQ